MASSNNAEDFEKERPATTGEIDRKLNRKVSMEEPISPSSQAPTRPPMINSKICIALVGLPARGKTYISRKLSRYLRWIGLDTKVFNVGEYRRSVVGANKPHDFFRPDNEEALRLRKECAVKALEDLKSFLIEENGQAAIYDATNSTVERRELIMNHLKGVENAQVFFIESICDDPKIIETNIKTVKLTSPDYKGADPEEAVTDFLERIKNYEKVYQTLDSNRDKDMSWVKIFNVDQRYEANRINGHLQAKLVYYLLNIHTLPRSIYLCRHGESICNLFGKIGGDADLSERGQQFAKSLKEFMDKQQMHGFNVWTSQLKRTIQSAQYLTGTIEQFKALNELDVGECEAMTYEEIQEKYPKEFALRDQDKYHYRYPKGESYEDVVNRLEPVIMELERKRDVLVICHQAVSRCIVGYFMDMSKEEIPYIKVPLHTIIKLTPTAHSCIQERFELDVGCVDTYREKPKDTDLSRSDSAALDTVPEHM